jgi:hypothetical protein
MLGRRRKDKEAQALLREIAGAIKARRLSLGMSLTDVGAAMGISYQAVVGQSK